MQKKVTTFKTSNWNKLTPKKWKRLGNACLFAIPLLSPVIAGYPIDPIVKVWISSVLSTVLVVAKFVTKFFAEEETK